MYIREAGRLRPAHPLLIVFSKTGLDAVTLLLGLDTLDLAPLAYVLGTASISDRTDFDVVLGLLFETLELE